MSQRIDSAMVEQGIAQSRERAKALIMEGVVLLDGVKVQKLQKAVDCYGVELKDKVCIDVGASTGGFTDCMLMHGAKKVYAVDVGYGQLDWKLRNDDRVVCMERHNARIMNPDWFSEIPAFASVDVSFISIKLILPRLAECLANDGEAVVLVKPQFEAGRGKVGKNGVVRDAQTHEEVLNNAIAFAIENGFGIKAVDYSPITGPKGNIEFLLYLSRCEGEHDTLKLAEKAGEIVMQAHEDLD